MRLPLSSDGLPALHLGLLAEVGRPRPEPHLGDRAPSAGTELAVTSVHGELVAAWPTLRVDEVTRGSAVLDRLVDDLDRRTVQATDLLGREGLGCAVVAEAGLEEDLVAVHRADPDEERGVHEDRLELGLLAEQALAEGGTTAEEAEAIYRLTSMPTFQERFVIPPLSREMAIESRIDPFTQKREGGFGFRSPAERRF